ncbi:mechanosensitive ion channel family protein [Thermodesulfobacteriota bacterium]
MQNQLFEQSEKQFEGLCFLMMPFAFQKVFVHLALYAAICIFATTAYTQQHSDLPGTGDTEVLPTEHSALQFYQVNTDSPRDTLQTFLQLTKDFEKGLLVYWKDQSRANANNVRLIGAQFIQLLDLSSVPNASRREIGIDATAALLDIFGRLDMPRIESVPGIDDFEDGDPQQKWSVPHTPLAIVRIEDGPREGEFLFSERTVSIAQTFSDRIQHIPLQSSLGIEDWQDEIVQLHGPAIPVGLVSSLPEFLYASFFDTPLWKVITVIILAVFTTALLTFGHRIINRRKSKHKIPTRLRCLITPVVIILTTLALMQFITYEVNVTGLFAQFLDSTATLIAYLSTVWVVWLLISTLVEWIILSPKIPDESLNAGLLRLGGKLVGFLGGGLILGYAAQDLGLPVMGLIAGLGVGGLAVALAIRPTLENLIGGLILYLDHPVHVGDFCNFGDKTGTVESIGIRSTTIRARDRTLISIPNATFADMVIVNWARCDKMLILTMIGLRYETEPDQLRYVLAKLREMFHAHPKIDPDTVRVRFSEYGASSLDIQIRVYALTNEWNQFYAIREDVFLRVNEIVGESGTGFAFPSQTLYLGRDDGLDEERSDNAKEKVESWRKSGRLPFPKMSGSRIKQLADSLDYPPRGSYEFGSLEEQINEEAEPLSAPPEIKDEKNIDEQSEDMKLSG